MLNKAARYIVETGKSITAWGQHRIHKITKLNEYGEEVEVVEDIPSENLQNWYPVIQSNKGTGSHPLDLTLLFYQKLLAIVVAYHFYFRLCQKSHGTQLCREFVP